MLYIYRDVEFFFFLGVDFRALMICIGDCRQFCYGTQAWVWSLSKRNANVSRDRFKRMNLKPSCSGSLVNDPEGWLPVTDQVLLTAGVCLTYMAGVIPIKRSFQKDIFDSKRVSESSTSFGR